MHLVTSPPLRAYYADLTLCSEFRILIMRIFSIFLFSILCVIFAHVKVIHKLLSNIPARYRRHSMTFGEKLRRARREKGLTQAELANQAGLGCGRSLPMKKAKLTRRSAPPTRHWPIFWVCRRTTCTTRKPRPARRRCPAPSGRTASGGTRNCCRTVPPGREIPPMKLTAKKWRNRPMRTPRAITINRLEQRYRKSRSVCLGEGLSDAIANLQGPLPVRRYTSRR